MFGEICTKIILIFAVCSFVQASVCAEEFDYGRYRTPCEIRYDFSDYMSNVNEKIQKHWNMPEVIEQGQVTVLFKIDKNGEIVSANVEKSSGNLLFDESAIEAIKASAPFEVIPEEAKREYISVKYSFEASIVKTDEVKELVRKSEEFERTDSKMALYYIDKAIKEAAEYEAQDKARKEAIDARNEADSFVFQTEKALNEVGDKVDAGEKANVEADLQALKDLLEKTKDQEMTSDQVSEMKAAQEKLMSGAQNLFAKMYEQAQGAAGAAGAGPDMSGMGGADAGSQTSAPDDDIIDGDFREV